MFEKNRQCLFPCTNVAKLDPSYYGMRRRRRLLNQEDFDFDFDDDEAEKLLMLEKQHYLTLPKLEEIDWITTPHSVFAFDRRIWDQIGFDINFL